MQSDDPDFEELSEFLLPPCLRRDCLIARLHLCLRILAAFFQLLCRRIHTSLLKGQPKILSIAQGSYDATHRHE